MKKTSLLLAAGLAATTVHADWNWLDFSSESTVSGAVNGIFAYYYPNADEGSNKTANHTATLGIVDGQAELDFVLDGESYPAAGIGFMLPSADAYDLSAMTGVKATMTVDAARTLRVSLNSNTIDDYTTVADQGVNLGTDYKMTAGTATTKTTTSWTYPTWATDPADYGVSEFPTKAAVLKEIFAIQFGVSCATSTCDADDGYIKIDDVVLLGVNPGAWSDVPSASASTTKYVLWASEDGTAKANNNGGYLYAYGDGDDNGASQCKDESGEYSDCDYWTPTSGDPLMVSYSLDKSSGENAGYVTLATQLGAPDGEDPIAYSISGATAIGFTIVKSATFDETNNYGITLKVPTSDVLYDKGESYLYHIPASNITGDEVIVPISALAQPGWATQVVDFDATSVRAFEWEVKTWTGTANEGYFTVDNITIYGISEIGESAIRGNAARAQAFSASWNNGVLSYSLPTGTWNSVEVVKVDGSKVASFAAGTSAKVDLTTGSYFVVARSAGKSLVAPLAVAR